MVMTSVVPLTPPTINKSPARMLYVVARVHYHSGMFQLFLVVGKTTKYNGSGKLINPFWLLISF